MNILFQIWWKFLIYSSVIENKTRLQWYLHQDYKDKKWEARRLKNVVHFVSKIYEKGGGGGGGA